MDVAAGAVVIQPDAVCGMCGHSSGETAMHKYSARRPNVEPTAGPLCWAADIAKVPLITARRPAVRYGCEILDDPRLRRADRIVLACCDLPVGIAFDASPQRMQRLLHRAV